VTTSKYTRDPLPRIGSTLTAERGPAWVALKAATPREDGGLGAVFHRLAEADFGVDGHLQILNQPTREATGRLVGIQIKAGPSYFRESVRDGWIVRIPRSTVAYWRDYSVPVLLVLVDTETDTGYWARVSDTDFVLAGDSYKIHVPQTQKFDASSAAAVEAIAAKAPASLASRIELHSRLASEEPTVRKALDDARTPQELTAAADRAVAFAGALQRAGRPYDAAFVWRRGVQAYFKAEQPERGLVSLTGLVGSRLA